MKDANILNIIDIDRQLAEVYEQNKFCSEAKKNSEPKQDICTSSVDVSPAHLAADKSNLNKEEVFRQLELLICNGMLWESDPDDFVVSPQVVQSLYQTAIKEQQKSTAEKSMQQVLEEMKGWTGTSIDILSPYGDIDYGAAPTTFQLQLPLKVYARDDGIVLQARFTDISDSPEKLNLKKWLNSQLNRINLSQVKISLGGNEFKLEIPWK